MSPGKDRSRPGEKAAPAENYGGVSLSEAATKRRALRQLLATVDLNELIRVRAVQQTLLEATWAHWMRRSESFSAVGTPDCDAIAEACRNHARLLSGEFGEVDEAWPGCAEDLAALVGGGGPDACP